MSASVNNAGGQFYHGLSEKEIPASAKNYFKIIELNQIARDVIKTNLESLEKTPNDQWTKRQCYEYEILSNLKDLLPLVTQEKDLMEEEEDTSDQVLVIREKMIPLLKKVIEAAEFIKKI